MIVRDAMIEDFPHLKLLLSREGIESSSLFHALQEASDSLVVENDGIKGFVLVQRLGDLHEVTHWFLPSGFELLFKSLQRKVKGSLAVSERLKSRERIDFLKNAGFRVVNSHEGVYRDDKAVMLVKD